MHIHPALTTLLTLSLLTACGGKEEPAPAPEATAPVAAPAPEPVASPVADTPDANATDSPVAMEVSVLYTARCASCHGDLGQGLAGNPALNKLNAGDTRARLEAYRAGQTIGPKSAVMIPMAKNLSDTEIQALARYLGN
jgi:cytochrome c553